VDAEVVAGLADRPDDAVALAGLKRRRAVDGLDAVVRAVEGGAHQVVHPASISSHFRPLFEALLETTRARRTPCSRRGSARARR